MTTRQTVFSNGKRTSPNVTEFADVATFFPIYDLGVGKDAALVAATDRVEMFILPAFMMITDMILIGFSGAVMTATVGMMTGAAGDGNDDTRTVGVEFFNASSINNVVTRMSQASGFAVQPTDYDRGVGVIISADLAQGAGRLIKLVVSIAPHRPA